MREIIPVSIPSDCTLLQDAKKLYSGGTSTSFIFREGLKALLEKQTGELKNPLPNWRHFNKVISDASPEELKKIEAQIKQFQNLLDFRRTFKKVVKNFD